ncbi:hypothetical protein QEN19_002459 [Hanseniaspora menglaensis]
MSGPIITGHNLVCKNCKGTEFVKDISNANNDTVCNNCGVVKEENPIVSEVTFGESSSGAAVVHGSFLAAGQAHSGSSGALESREQTIQNARRKLRAVSYALQIPEYITEAATQWYKLCLTYNFVQGRKSQNVISACLYVACRKEKTHHMLIDFSSRLQVSVYSIGSTFLKMCKQLHITDLPLVDPSLYIQSFATKLQLGEIKNVVINDAIKLAQRMSRDWMYEGRRPAGIAGACLLLACRMNNIRITHNEIVAVSHVGEETLQSRLNEFKTTHSAQMSIKNFRENFDNNENDKELPPSLKKNLKKIQKINKKMSDYMITDSDTLKSDPLMAQVLNEQELSSNELNYYLKKLDKVRLDNVTRLKKTHGIDDDEVMGLSDKQKLKLQKRKLKLEEKSLHTAKNVKETLENNQSVPSAKEAIPEEDEEEEEESDDEDDDIMFNIKNDPYRPKNLHLLPTTDSMLDGIPDGSNFSDLDEDEEILGSILDPEESKQKERIWVGLHAEFLIEQEEKRLKKEADILTGNAKPDGRKKSRRKSGERGERVKKIEPEVSVMRDPVKDQFNMANLNQYFQKPEQLMEGLDPLGNLAVDSGQETISAKIEPENAADSVKNMLQANATFSKKINYKAIDSLFK